jgi:hypothetical protein
MLTINHIYIYIYIYNNVIFVFKTLNIYKDLETMSYVI